MQEEKLNAIREAAHLVTKLLLREGEVVKVHKNYPYIPHVLALFAKQTNLLDSTLVLYKENMAEEAIILFRSLLNNCMLIHYLLDDTDGTKLKEYTAQPTKNQLSLLHNIKSSLNKGWFPKEQAEKYKDIHKIIRNIEKDLKRKGISTDFKSLRPLSISTLSKQSRQLTLMYQSYYAESSKHEHSDYSVLGNYIHEYEESGEDIQFRVITYLSNERLNEFSINTSASVYFKSFFAIINHLIKSKVDLWDEEEILDLQMLTLKIGAIQGVDINEFIENIRSKTE